LINKIDYLIKNEALHDFSRGASFVLCTNKLELYKNEFEVTIDSLQISQLSFATEITR